MMRVLYRFESFADGVFYTEDASPEAREAFITHARGTVMVGEWHGHEEDIFAPRITSTIKHALLLLDEAQDSLDEADKRSAVGARIREATSLLETFTREERR